MPRQEDRAGRTMEGLHGSSSSSFNTGWIGVETHQAARAGADGVGPAPLAEAHASSAGVTLGRQRAVVLPSQRAASGGRLSPPLGPELISLLGPAARPDFGLQQGPDSALFDPKLHHTTHCGSGASRGHRR